MSEPYLGEVRMFGGNFQIRGWAFCNGQLVPIAQNTPLFALLGTTFGGNGQTTFGLPDLRGRVPIHSGQAPGLSNYDQGNTGGVETVTLTSATVPPHLHGLQGENAAGTTDKPAGKALAGPTPSGGLYRPAGGAQVLMADGTIGPTGSGGNQPHENRQPYLAVTFLIAVEGIFPPRN